MSEVDFSKTRIQFRRGTANEFQNSNPILGEGEPAYAEGAFKVGDGSNPWSILPDLAAGTAKNSASTTISESATTWTPAVSADLIRVTSTSDVTISSIDSSYAKKQFIVLHDDSGNTTDSIIFKHNATGITAANKIHCSPNYDIKLRYGHAAMFTYESASNMWVAIRMTYADVQTLSTSEYNTLVGNNATDPNTIYIVT